MIKVRELTRRKEGGKPCAGCRLPLRPGDVYREAIFVRADWLDRPFLRVVVHDGCIPLEERELWRERYSP